MAKVIITADLHLHNHRSDSRRIDDGLSCLIWIYSTAKSLGINSIIVAGDFLHHRFLLPSYAYSKASEIVLNAKNSGISTFFLLGNHDMHQEDSWAVHSLKPMSGMATIIDKPCTLEIEGTLIDFLPYTPTPSKFIKDFKPNKTLISHLAVADAVLNSRYDIKSVEDDSKEKETISCSVFDKWKKVWLGHYHYGQQVSSTVEYIGSPMQLNFGEAGQSKHIVVYDTEKLIAEYIENTISPKFHIIEEPKEVDALQIENAYVQMRSSGTMDNKFELRKALSKLGAREIEFVPIGNKQAITEETTTALGNITDLFNNKRKLVEEYCIHNKPDLDLELLKKIGMEIIESEPT